MSGPLLCSRQRAIWFPLKRSCSPRAHCPMASGVCSKMELSLFPVVQSYRQRACRWLAQSIPIKAANCADLLDMFISVYFCFLVEFAFFCGAVARTRWLSFGEGIIVQDLERVLHLRIRYE